MVDLKMTIELWADIVCPFSYIAKRRIDQAINSFSSPEKIKLIWKSYQLNPDLKSDATLPYFQHLEQTKGWNSLFVEEVIATMSKTASESGITFHLDKAIVANSFDAHRLIHLACLKNVEAAVCESLFSAHFCEGKDISSHDLLTEIGVRNGLIAAEIRETLESDQFAKEVKQDIYEAQLLGSRAVPFVIVNKKYTLSGAQGTATFLSAINLAWQEMQV